MSKVIAQIVSDLKKYCPQKIILFGSQARGEADQFSDFDIVVIKETKKRFLERLREVALLLRDPPGPLNVFVYSPKEFEEMKALRNPFIERVLREGKIIYETKHR